MVVPLSSEMVGGTAWLPGTDFTVWNVTTLAVASVPALCGFYPMYVGRVHGLLLIQWAIQLWVSTVPGSGGLKGRASLEFCVQGGDRDVV